MSAAEIKQHLYKAIEEIDDEDFLQAVYTIVASKAAQGEEYELTAEQLNMLEERRAQYLRGEGKSYTWDEVKERLKNRK